MKEESKAEIINRLRSVAGHVNGIARMVDEDKYCIDVIHQIQAVQAALNKISLKVLDDHMHTCVIEAIEGEDLEERERVLSEIRDVFEVRGKL
ncbi:MAG: metal-sensitive transcriptional regulator [Chloroflexi bacterium]|nr:metal-sensitive transcriptional regulator [Chloroflexota bacterium]